MTPQSSVGLLETSVITLAELSVGPEVSKTLDERQKGQLVLQHTEASFDPLPFDAACARRLAIVAGSLRQSGRKTPARAFDALIAATALAHNLPLYTRNAHDFGGIAGLDVRPVTPNV